jgi:adenylosuccinate lyase
MENVALWHERDITHSSVERVIIPDSCILLDYMTAQFADVVEHLLVYPEAMRRNLDLTHGLIHSQAVLLALAGKGMQREQAYRLVQEAAMKVWSEGTSFKDLLRSSADVMKYLSTRELEDLFDDGRDVRHVETIFKNLGLSEGS